MKKEKGMLKGLCLKRKITFLSVVAGVLYVWMLIFPIYDDWEDHKMSFLRGYGVEGYENKEGLVKDSLFDVCYLSVTPKESVFLFPEEVQAYRGETIDSRFSRIEIALPDKFIQKSEVNSMETVQGILLFIMVVFFVLLPVRFFKLISSLQDGNFFDRRNVRFIRQMGWLLLGV
ncbi:hypothetical protein [Marinilabilia salmonicolor]|uniref:hypothetical protein n=1 Tax=Marinilabilia salmonicolor TaxID=989 RepID=UPI0003024446|nr:hypothetical protein [Marinilabilia salmonicolor]